MNTLTAKPSPIRRKTTPFALFLLGCLCLWPWLAAPPQPAAAQSQSNSYWQYPIRASRLITADMNNDGIDEFVVADENNVVHLINADGTLQWQYTAPGPVLVLSAVNVDSPENPSKELALATADQLILLTTQGQKVWQVYIEPLSTPPSLLIEGSQETKETWLTQYQTTPVSISPFDADNDGHQEILLLLESGQLHRYDAQGHLEWRYIKNSNPFLSTQPQMIVADIDGDGANEIILGRGFSIRRFSQLALIDEDVTVWDRPIEGRITALTLVTFQSEANPYIAVGNNQGQLSLFDKERQPRIWLRTLNKPITSLTAVQLPDGPALVAGTAVGRVVAYNENGIRYWDSQLTEDASRAVVTLTAAPPVSLPNPPIQPVLLAIVGPSAADDPSSLADIVLLGGENGGILKTVAASDYRGLSRLVDINGDHHIELATVRTNTLELSGLGIGASKNAKGWEYNLRAKPQAFLVADLDQDGANDLLVSAQDGRLHYLNANGNHQWVTSPHGSLTHMALLTSHGPEPPHIVAVYSHVSSDLNGEAAFYSTLELKNAQGEHVWDETLSAQITALEVSDINDDTQPEIILGADNGSLQVYDITNTLLWETALDEPIEQFLVLESNQTHGTELLAATATQVFRIYSLSDASIVTMPIATSAQPIHHLYGVNQPGGELATALLAFITDGTARGYNWRGIQLPQWPSSLGGVPTVVLPANDFVEEAFFKEVFDINSDESFLVATNQDQLLRLDISENRPSISWRLSGMDDVTSLYWGDLDGDTLPDIAVGDINGRVQLLTRELDAMGEDLDVVDPIFAITVLRREDDPRANLVIMTENGLIHLFRGQENGPPLLTNPVTEVSENLYSINVSIQDVENDEVTVYLETWHPLQQIWVPQGTPQTTTRNGPLYWPSVNLPPNLETVRYRFRYDDGFHEGTIMPAPGPAPIINEPIADAAVLGLASLSIIGLILALALIHQANSPAAHAHRFYRQLTQRPIQTLHILEQKYTHTDGAPDFLLHLASFARQNSNHIMASLADGIFLLTDQPDAGLAIITAILDEVSGLEPVWDNLERWQMIYKTSQELLEAPSITELSLLRPRHVALLTYLEETNSWIPVLDALLPILTNLRDSERVELAEDRLIYLNEANFLLKQLQSQFPEFSTRIEKTVSIAITKRWLGLVTAEIEALRGRAKPVITLKTKRLVPNGRTEIALEIHNNGRAAAENVMIILDEDPAYAVHSNPQLIPLLPAGHNRQVNFAIEPKVTDRFRISLTLTYDDRNQQDKVVAFGDMVHLLSPTRVFKPISNPYMPGTPLRRNNPIFVGRQHLFDFIAENAGHVSQRNVLILIGQRRTGKTSVLLRLDQHLPAHLLPIYIDCQSLGVTPGMPALFHDLAWYIADALAAQNIVIDVPESSVWQDNPTRHFQRYFLPQVTQLLPSDTTLLLVFDEFEAFEHLVNDGILPPTLFPYLRHLMQHSERLSFVFVGTRRLEEMSTNYWSVLFNIALYHKIDFLSDKSATQLITEPVAPDLVYDDLALDKILRVTAGHPYFVQLVCYTLIKRANTQQTAYVTISDVNATLDEMLRLGEVHFAYLWQRSTLAERAILAAVAHLMDVDRPFRAGDPIQYLESYGIHITPHDMTIALNRLVERDILREITDQALVLYQLKIGLVGLWVAQNKSLSKLYSSEAESKGEPTNLPGSKR